MNSDIIELSNKLVESINQLTQKDDIIANLNNWLWDEEFECPVEFCKYSIELLMKKLQNIICNSKKNKLNIYVDTTKNGSEHDVSDENDINFGRFIYFSDENFSLIKKQFDENKFLFSPDDIDNFYSSYVSDNAFINELSENKLLFAFFIILIKEKIIPINYAIDRKNYKDSTNNYYAFITNYDTSIVNRPHVFENYNGNNEDIRFHRGMDPKNADNKECGAYFLKNPYIFGRKDIRLFETFEYIDITELVFLFKYV